MGIFYIFYLFKFRINIFTFNLSRLNKIIFIYSEITVHLLNSASLRVKRSLVRRGFSGP